METKVQTINLIEVTVIGKDEENGKKYAIALDQQNRTYYIPEEEIGTQFQADRIQDKIGALMGATVTIIPLGREGKRNLASRKKAMEVLNKEYYDKLKDGDIVEGRIIGLSPRKLVVEVYGQETFLKPEDIDTRWISDLRDEYKIGQKVKLKVISKNEMKFTMKGLNPTPWDNYRGQYKPDQEYIATVKGLMKNGIMVELPDKIQVLCTYPRFRSVPRPGSKVVIKITDIKPEQQRAWGRIMRIVNM